VDHEQWMEKEGELTKSIQGKVAENQDIERPKSCNPGSERQEKAEQSDLDASQAAHGFTQESMDFRDLYEGYSESRVILLPVEPYLIHAYWEVTHSDIEKAKQWLGNDYRSSQAVLRFYDITNIIFDGTNAHSTFDVDIDLQSRNWYIDLWSPDKSYFVDLGFKTRDGFFLPVIRSNIARTPCAWPAPEVDEHYMFTSEDAEEDLPKIETPEEPVRDDLIEAERAEAEVEIRKAGPQKEKGLPDEDKSTRIVDLPQAIARKLGLKR
jgi:hypothetical protein